MINIPTDEEMMLLMIAVRNNNIAHVTLFLDHYPDAVNMPDDGYDTAFHLAVTYRHMKLAKLLLDRGADIEQRRIPQCRPLYRAASRGMNDVVQFLLENGADPHHVDAFDKKTPAQIARSLGFNETETLINDWIKKQKLEAAEKTAEGALEQTTKDRLTKMHQHGGKHFRPGRKS